MPFLTWSLASLDCFSTVSLSPFSAAASAALSAASAVVHSAFLALAALTSAWAAVSAACASALMADLDAAAGWLACWVAQPDRPSRAAVVRASKTFDIVLSPQVVWRSGGFELRALAG